MQYFNCCLFQYQLRFGMGSFVKVLPFVFVAAAFVSGHLEYDSSIFWNRPTVVAWNQHLATEEKWHKRSEVEERSGKNTSQEYRWCKTQIYLWFFSTAMWYPFYIITLDRKCVKWCQTGGCKPDGPREPQYDKTCSTSIDKGWSGYCECVGGRRTLEKDCKTDVATTCEEACSKVLRYISWCY